MPNRTAAVRRKPNHEPPEDYSHCACSRLYSPLQCAGINRHEVEDERALRGRSSEPLGPEFCVVPREEQGEA